jgi:threonine aldolase
MPNDKVEKLNQEFSFNHQAKVDENHSAIRLVTSWATTEENVEKLIEKLVNL